MALLGINVPPHMQEVLNEEAKRQGELPPAYVNDPPIRRKPMTSTALATQNGNLAVQQADFTAQQIDLIRHAIVPGANEMEFDLFLNLCKAKRLDPLTRQIYGIKTSKGLQMFASIDGLRVIAQRSGQYAGQVGPFWCGEDGKWQDVWLSTGKPAAAKIGVLRKGWTEPMWGVATLKSYGKESPTWNAMPDVMLAKVAESMALRKAFPDDLSALYVREEFDTPDSPEPPVNAPQAQHSRPERTPVTAEVVDAETGEIREPVRSMEDVKRMTGEFAKALNLDAKAVQQYAKTIGANYRTLEGAIQLCDALEDLLLGQEDQVEDEEDYEGIEAAQGTLIGADTVSIARARDWTER